MKDDRKLLRAASQDILEIEERHAKVTPFALPGYTSETGEDGVHLRDYWRAVRKHLWLIIGTVALITTLATIYMARKPDIFEAQTRVQVDLENSGQALRSSQSGPVILNNAGNDPVYFNTQLQILTSSGLLRRVAGTLDLEHNAAFQRPPQNQNRSLWQRTLRAVGLNDDESGRVAANNVNRGELPVVESVEPATPREDLENLEEARRLAPYVQALRENLEVEPVRVSRSAAQDTRLIDIRYTNRDPMLAARIANTIAETLRRTNLERRTESSASTGDFLQRRIAELQDRIRNGEERLINYAQQNQILSLDAGQNTVVDRLTGLNRQLMEAENERRLAEAAYQAALRGGAADALASASGTQIQSTATRLNELRQRRVQLLSRYTEDWPEVREVDRQIAELERQIQDVRGRATSNILTNLETNYRQALARENSLRTAFNQQRGETLTQNEAAINYRIIQQEIETNRTLLNGLLQSSRENEVVRAETPNNIYILDHALVPEVPVAPKRVQGVLLAFALALILGVSLAFLLEYLNDTIRTNEDIERFLRLPTLAMIPSIGSFTKRRLLPGLSGGRQSSNGHRRTGKELLINEDARSPLAEAYRQLRTSVLLSTAGRAPKTLLVTSSVPSEGKTTTSSNICASLAQTGASVLLVDGDMRRPRQHAIFETENKRGLSTILSSEMSEAEILATISHHEPSGIYILPSGPIPPNPAELLGSEQMRQLLAVLENAFDHVIIDSPPVASFTDSVLLSSIVDGVLLVVHGGKTSRGVARRSRQLLQDVGAHIIGIILNNVDLRSPDYYYYRGYYHYHQYYDPQEANPPA